MNVQKEVRNFLYEESLKEEFEDLTPDDSLLERGIIDSVRMMDLIAFLEDKFSIKVDDDDLYPENFESLAAIENYVKQKMQ